MHDLFSTVHVSHRVVNRMNFNETGRVSIASGKGGAIHTLFSPVYVKSSAVLVKFTSNSLTQRVGSYCLNAPIPQQWLRPLFSLLLNTANEPLLLNTATLNVKHVHLQNRLGKIERET
ncbi:hypothetical protein Y032_0119g871 [Ancylostoma ceylanicum]|uniref:Uncharacterized protein n=1 Tax=Ancylostoma ceylanicum TaxID=53326 RepID=A0A016TBC6_9BILA|nr:hypothetical protein Y032_0119g871 [Ancylostoma ceylanicum]